MRRFLIGAGVAVSAAVLALFGADAMRVQRGFSPAMGTDAAVNAILGRSCADCHSERTVWPWYAHLPAVGAVLRRDVQAARAQFNLSEWTRCSPQRRGEALAEIAALVRNGHMPPSRYTLLHPRARLSAADIGVLTDWTIAERRKLSAAVSGRSEGQ